jgi:ATP-dependent exoDNAse (exonuclease V) beta subunit
MNFVVYKSSAGSGKTHTLVKEYIRLLIENPERYRNILAITFTNKAANEMKSRIIEDLQKLLAINTTERDGKFKDLVQFLTTNLHLSEKEIALRADKSLSLILHNYSSFAVSTIDSFVHKLVRSFARDLHLPPNFEVELDTEKLISKSVDLLISKVGNDKELTKVLVKFVESKMEDEKSWNIENELKQFTKILLNEDSFQSIKKLQNFEPKDFINIGDKLRKWIAGYETQLITIATDAYKLIEQKGIELSSFSRGVSGIGNYYKNLASGRLDKIKPNSYVRATVEEDKWFAGKCPDNDRGKIISIKDQLGEAYLKIQNLIEKDLANYNLFRLIIQNLYPIAVLNAIEKVMEEFRQNENIVHISEFNKRIAKIVGNEHIPFIYERVGEKYRHFMVDEFQDTSKMQWHNMLPLYENSLSNNRFNMIVGDGKQAIYRFRSGEVEQFARLPEVYNLPAGNAANLSSEVLLRSQYKEEVLDTNFRSTEEIVKFNNGFFSFIRQKLNDRFASIYNGVEQKFIPEKPGGSVHIEFMDHSTLKKDEFVQVECEKIFQLITTDLGTIPLKDIAILTRSNDEASEIAQFLLDRGIIVVSAEALLLSASAEVRFLISFLNYLNDGNNKIPISEIITYLFYKNLLDYPTLDMAFDACAELSKANDDEKGVQILEKLLQKKTPDLSFASLRTTTLFETVGQLVHFFRIDPEGNNPFILFFLEVIQEFTSKYNDGIAEFLKYWEESKRKHSIIVPLGTEAVQIMTIHKAKGLQFPVVIYSFAETTIMPTKKYHWVDLQSEVIPELGTVLLNNGSALQETIYSDLYEEEYQKSFLDLVNLLYVTLTRPEKHLYILTKDKTNDKKGGWSHKADYADIPDLFYDYLVHLGWWDDKLRTYVFGKQPLSGLRDITHSNLEELEDKEKAPIGKWQSKMVFNKQAPKVWDIDDPDKSRRWGNLVHAILAGIEHTGELDAAVEKAFHEGMLLEDEKDLLKTKIVNILNHSEIKPLYEKGVKVMNEKDILMGAGHTVRPDRLVFSSGELSIIDYKTGQEEEFHRQQLNGYAGKLQQMGFGNIKKYLLYIDEEKVVEV